MDLVQNREFEKSIGVVDALIDGGHGCGKRLSLEEMALSAARILVVRRCFLITKICVDTKIKPSY